MERFGSVTSKSTLIFHFPWWKLWNMYGSMNMWSPWGKIKVAINMTTPVSRDPKTPELRSINVRITHEPHGLKFGFPMGSFSLRLWYPHHGPKFWLARDAPTLSTGKTPRQRTHENPLFISPIPGWRITISIYIQSIHMFTHIVYPPQCQQQHNYRRNKELKTSVLQYLHRGCFVGCAIRHLPTYVAIYIMAGRAFVVAKEEFHHGNGNIMTLRRVKRWKSFLVI